MTPEHIQALEAVNRSARNDEIVTLDYNADVEHFLIEWAMVIRSEGGYRSYHGRQDETELPWVVFLV